MDLITRVPPVEHWCAPAIGIYGGCPPEHRFSYLVHNWVVFAANIFSVATLLIFLVIRFNFSRLASANVYFVTSAMCMLGNIFMGLFALLREVDPAPRWLVALMYSCAGTMLLPGVNYLLLSFIEIQRTDSLLVYSGLQKYRPAWITHLALNCVWFFVFYPLSTLSPTLYAIFARLFFGGFLLSELSLFLPGVYFGLKLIKIQKSLKVASSGSPTSRITYLMLFLVCAASPTLTLATISPFLIDGVVWLWHLFYFLLTMSTCFLSALLAWWSVDVSRKINSEKSFQKTRTGSLAGSLTAAQKIHGSSSSFLTQSQ